MLPGESSSTDPPQQMSGAPNTEHVTYALPIGMVGFDAFSTINELTYTFDADGNLLDTSLVDQLGNNKYSGEDEASVFRPWPSDEPAFLGKQDKAVSNSPTVSPGTSASATASSHTITRPSNSPSTASPGTSVDQRDNIAPAIEVISYNLNDAQSGPQSKRRRAAKGKLNTRTKASASRGNVLQPGTAPKTAIQKHINGTAAGIMTVFGLDQKVRTAVSDELRLASVITRRLGACKRCSRNKFRCNMPENIYEPCEKCKHLLKSFYTKHPPKVKFMPCVRTEILELSLHRKGPMIVNGLHAWMREKQDLLLHQTLRNSQVVFLTQGFGEGHENGLAIPISLFEPKPGDRTAFHWTDPSGNLCSMELPPYFIDNIETARQNLELFLHGARSVYIETLLGDSAPIIRHTFQAALVHASFAKSDLISDALDTWVSSRFIESQWHIYCGGSLIGIEPANEPGHPYDGLTPITPMIDTQLDDLVIRHFIAPLSARFLRRLKAKINEGKPENWLEIYLAMFIMLSNVGWIVKDMMAQATWKGLKPGNRGGNLTQSFMHASKVMLSHFHFACAGSVPLWTTNEKSKPLHGITAENAEYLAFAKEELARQGKFSKWQELSMYQDDGYYCYQLLSQNWRGNIEHAGEVDDFTEEDFLSSSTT